MFVFDISIQPSKKNFCTK